MTEAILAPSSPLDILRSVELDLRASAFFRHRATAVLPALRRYADALKAAEPEWLTSDSQDARLVRGIEALPDSAPADAPQRILGATEVAARLGCVKPDGRIRDSFYKLAPRIGYRVGRTWRFRLERVEAFERGELS